MKSCLRAAGLLVALCASTVARAALPIELEVAIEGGLSLTAPQEWAKLLGQMRLAHVRLRGVRPGDQPKITPVGTEGRKRFRVVAILSRREELILPDRRFKIHDRKAMQAYFEELPQSEAAGAAPRGRFGLTEKQFHAVYDDLSQPVLFSTKGKTAREMLAKLKETFTVQVVINVVAAAGVAPSEVELNELSAGTALAIALRRDGLALVPESDHGAVRLRVARDTRRSESWPVGWKADSPPRLVVPKLYDSLTIEIGNYTVQQALQALQPRLEIPMIFDDWILAQRNIHPAEIQVKIARKKMFLKRAVDRVLSQSRLAAELRVDEQGQPFLWITQFGKENPRAEKH